MEILIKNQKLETNILENQRKKQNCNKNKL